jgi:hypothetical protein
MGQMDCGSFCGDDCNAVDGDLREVDYFGRLVLQVFHTGEWRGVCADSFGANEGMVACRQLGMSYSSYTAYVTGPSPDFWLDDLGCTGSEARLADCSHAGWGVHNCSSTSYVTLTCF